MRTRIKPYLFPTDTMCRLLRFFQLAIASLIWLGLLPPFLPAARVGGAFKPDAIVGLMRRVNDWQKMHPRMKESYRNLERAT
ncbi:MAG: hypothetical protein WCO56_24740 [Verrucomicrobiota bacterium]